MYRPGLPAWARIVKVHRDAQAFYGYVDVVAEEDGCALYDVPSGVDYTVEPQQHLAVAQPGTLLLDEDGDAVFLVRVWEAEKEDVHRVWRAAGIDVFEYDYPGPAGGRVLVVPVRGVGRRRVFYVPPGQDVDAAVVEALRRILEEG